MINSPLIRPYLLGGGSFGGGTLDSHDDCLSVFFFRFDECSPLFPSFSHHSNKKPDINIMQKKKTFGKCNHKNLGPGKMPKIIINETWPRWFFWLHLFACFVPWMFLVFSSFFFLQFVLAWLFFVFHIWFACMFFLVAFVFFVSFPVCHFLKQAVEPTHPRQRWHVSWYNVWIAQRDRPFTIDFWTLSFDCPSPSDVGSRGKWFAWKATWKHRIRVESCGEK